LGRIARVGFEHAHAVHNPVRFPAEIVFQRLVAAGLAPRPVKHLPAQFLGEVIGAKSFRFRSARRRAQLREEIRVYHKPTSAA
jgi:hypothetical protein